MELEGRPLLPRNLTLDPEHLFLLSAQGRQASLLPGSLDDPGSISKPLRQGLEMKRDAEGEVVVFRQVLWNYQKERLDIQYFTSITKRKKNPERDASQLLTFQQMPFL